jgi:small conductance mechanosensitive channel
VKTGDYWNVLFDTNESVKKQFDQAKINIPFPQRDVHLYQRTT